MAEFFDLHGNAQDAAEFGWTRIIKPLLANSKNIQQEVRKARRNAEVIISGGDDKSNRLASDCWELDIIGSPEMHSDKDFMHQMNSGIDYVIARECALKGISIEFCFGNVLNSHGRQRSKVLARMAQNVMICRYSGCDMIITTGSKDKWGVRNPRDLIAFGVVLGMTMDEAIKAVSEAPEKVLTRSTDRNDPNILLKGLEVKKWASEQKEKKIYGWY